MCLRAGHSDGNRPPDRSHRCQDRCVRGPLCNSFDSLGIIRACTKTRSVRRSPWLIFNGIIGGGGRVARVATEQYTCVDKKSNQLKHDTRIRYSVAKVPNATRNAKAVESVRNHSACTCLLIGHLSSHLLVDCYVLRCETILPCSLMQARYSQGFCWRAC